MLIWILSHIKEIVGASPSRGIMDDLCYDMVVHSLEILVEY
ncbi:18681_t:CDS:2 [Entrophospora sp. SA101]|nr:18681_t:CDS:2 [Entrophospora sp. SA101]